MVISRKQEHLHSYNSQKCINDHQQKGGFRGPGDKRLTNTILSCMKLSFLGASSCLKCQPTAKVKKRIKSKLGNKQTKKFKSFFLSYKARCAHQGGRDKVCLLDKALPPPPFSWISMPWKKLSFHEYSTSK